MSTSSAIQTQADSMSQTSARQRIAKVLSRLTRLFDVNRIDIVTIMSVLLVLQHSPEIPTTWISVIAFAGLLVPSIRRSGLYWIFIAIYRGVVQFPNDWALIDNHQYLITWWCLGLGLTLFALDRDKAIAVTSRLLLGLCFLFATLWKLRSPDFLNGNYFAWTFATDRKFRAFAETILGLPTGAQATNLKAKALLDLGDVGSVESIITSSILHTAARITALYTLIIEGSLAIAFLVPQRFRLASWAPWILLTFILTVYPIRPVVGFALLLIVLSIASQEKSNRSWLPIATTLFILIPIFSEFSSLLDALG